MRLINMLLVRFLLTALCVVSFWSPQKASAQWLGFFRLEGVTGESADTNHVGWVDIMSVSTSNLTNSNPSAGFLSFEKVVDKASPNLELLCAQKKHSATGTLDLTRTNSTLVQFLRLNLTNVIVSSVSSLGTPANETRPLEDVSLSAGVISWNYTQFNPANGLPRSYTQSIWNFQNNSGSSGTNNPLFIVSGIRQTSGVEITWPAIAGKTYRLYGAPSLNGAFTPLAEVSAPATGTMTNSQPLNSPAMFYLVEQEP